MTPTPSSVMSLVLMPIYGQSLSLGSAAGGTAQVISAEDPANRMFNQGVRVHYDSSLIGTSGNPNTPVNPDSMASLVNLEEQLNPDGGNFGETVATGIATKQDTLGLYVTTGRGAYTVDSLSRFASASIINQNHYQNTYAVALHGKLLADTNGFEYRLGPMAWLQGEADAAAANTKAVYKDSLTELVADLKRDYQYAAFVDTSNFKLVGHQQAFTQAGRTYGEIAVALIELHREGTSDIVCLGPGYTYEYTTINNVHMTSNGYRNAGEKYGQAMRTILDGGTWNPCHITAVSRSTTTITVDVYVPEPPLVVDTSLVAAVADNGFEYSGANITGVSIIDNGVGDNNAQIEITIDADAGGTLSFAYENSDLDLRVGPVVGARGNFRDSESAVTDNDSTPLYNWLCTDQWVVA